MLYFTDEELDRLISEDVPYFDMSTRLAKFGSRLARIQFSTTEPSVICCTEEVMRFFTKFNISPTLVTLSGEYIEGKVKFLEGEGLAKHLHTIWRVSANLLEYASGIATMTRLMVEEAHRVNPHVIITATRKTIPYTRKVAAKAVLSGGGNMNRLSLSENIMFFPNHYKFFGGLNGLISKVDKFKEEAGGRPITVETNNAEDAIALSKTNVDVIQLVNLSTDEISELTEKIRLNNSHIKIAAAGGINLENLKDYVSTGVDIIITSFPNHCKPAIFKVEIDPFED
ncbi:MAG: ModD protein [Bacteroidales bacterium]|nr:ModD protein [Bacteroidales bacterium]MBN2817586.1 ModD protein [Bacteroidales bacterium]